MIEIKCDNTFSCKQQLSEQVIAKALSYLESADYRITKK